MLGPLPGHNNAELKHFRRPLLPIECCRCRCHTDRRADRGPQISDKVLKRFLSILSDLIFDSSVDRGMPNFAAAPVGPNTRPRLAFRASSIMFFSCSQVFEGAQFGFQVLLLEMAVAAVVTSFHRSRKCQIRKGSRNARSRSAVHGCSQARRMTEANRLFPG